MQSLLQLVIGMFCARYLGPDNYGLINYAASVVSFAVPLMQLGLCNTLVRELINAPEKEGEIMGTSMVMALASSVACTFFVWSFASIANHGETETIVVCVLYSLSLSFRAIELVKYWFHSKLQSKYPSMMLLCSYLVVSAYKIYLLVTQKSVYWFALVYSIEYGVTGLALLGIYHKLRTQPLSFSLSTARELFSRSKYYIFAALMVMAFQNTDHIMLKMMSGDAENGMYSAAITCAGVCQFVYTAIIDSMRPMILNAKKNEGRDSYERSLSTLYCVIIYLSLAQGIGFTVFAKLIVTVLYGEAYLPAVTVLQILVWYLAFSFMGTIRNIWILAEEKQKLLWKINLAGVLVNVALNALFIPVWGARGAALASFLTQLFANFIFGFLWKPLRENNRFLIKGLNPKLLLGMFHKK